MSYQIFEVEGIGHEHALHAFNAKVSEWPPLQTRHLTDGYWWFAYLDETPVAFAGLTPMDPFAGYGYLKRCYVSPDHHGHCLQYRLMVAREAKAKQLGWTHLVSECLEDNFWSAANFRKAGFSVTAPEQRWGNDPERSIYWVKVLEKA